MSQSPYEVDKIGEGFWRIGEARVCSYLLAGSRQALLIDTGYGAGDLRGEVERLTSLPVTLVNTHADRDHIGGNAGFGAALMHPAEFDRYRQAGGENPLPLWEGAVLDLGGRSLEVVLIPGHTPGSIALLDRENRLLISGDTVQNGSIFMFGDGRNMSAYMASLERLMALGDAFDLVYAAHGDAPVKRELIPKLLEGARRIQRGEIEGGEFTERPLPCRVFDVGCARFLME